MLKRLNTEQQLAPYVTQFVPLKVDTASPEYQRLQRKHQSEGNSIPKIFVIRADGKKLYAKSGSLSGDQLPTLMVAAAREMGRPLDVKESKRLKEINSSIMSAIQEKNLKAAIVEFKKLKKLGEFGQIRSYAKAAIDNNQLAESLVASVKENAAEIRASVEALDDSIFSKLVTAVELKSAVGTVPQLKIEMNQLDKLIRTNKSTALLYPTAKKVSAAITKLRHKSSRVVDSARRTLTELASNDADSRVKEYVAGLLTAHASDSDADQANPTFEESTLGIAKRTTVRKWTSADGKFSIEASFVKKANGTISLKKTNGDVITVPLARLSETDRDFINKIK